ncbi:MAG TPA: alanine racemase [Acidimicrobiia bacterium]|nr:alanine racemase [Acidimicrobiia bacterium]
MTARAWETAEGAALAIPHHIETPSLVVDLPRVRENLDDMARFAQAAGVDLAPHVKTHRSVEFARMQIESGANRLCVAKLSEAEHFIDAGFDRLVMAYPIAGDDKYERAKRLIPRADLRLSVDSLDAARGLSRSLSGSSLKAEVLLQIDTGFHRTGVLPEPAVGLVRELVQLENLRFKGLITHEGHAPGAGSTEALARTAREAGVVIADLAEKLRLLGIAVDSVSVGSTATVKHSATSGVTEIRPGIYPFNDYGQVYIGTVGIERCAARVVSTVVSHAAPDRAIIDAGSKALSQDQLSIWDEDTEPLHGLIIGHPGWKLRRLSEEHGWLQWEGEGQPTYLEIGSKVQILPVHICSVFHVLGEAEIVEEGEHVGTWASTARGLSK